MSPRPLFAALTCAGLLACTDSSDRPRSPDDEPSDTDSDSDSDTDSDTYSDTDATGFDCSAIPDIPGSPIPLAAPRGHNDVVFNADGALVGWDGFNLLKATDADTVEVYAPNAETTFKLDMLPGGDLVATLGRGEVARIEPNGAIYPIATGIFPYGLAVGSDGLVYASSTNFAAAPAIWRIDPDTQALDLLLDWDIADWPRDIAFSADFSVLYVGTQTSGEIYKVPLDGNLNPTGDPQLLVTLPTFWHDSVEVDACGNVYVAGLFPPQLYRINADLSTTLLIEWTMDEYAHGFDWGDAAGGWNPESIYMALPDQGNTVEEVDLGIPGRQWDGAVIGGVTL